MTTAKTKTLVQPYLNFDGRCAEAIEFYQKAIGAEVDMLMHFKDAPPSPDSEQCGSLDPNKVMHCSFRIGDSTVMASDCQGTGKVGFAGFSLSVTVTSASEADRIFNALAEGGQVCQPLTQTFFSPRFGVVVDRFGLSWMIYMLPAA